MNIIHKGASIYYTDQGEGATVVLLHGFLEDHTMWQSFATHLKAKYRVITVDLLGHGKSECTGYIHSMEAMAAAIYAVLENLAITKVQIVGHSMGGYVGIAFAKTYPSVTLSLCLLNSTTHADSDERKDMRARANSMAKKQYEQLVRMSFMNLFDKKSKIAYKSQIATALHQAMQTPIQGYIAANAGMALRKDTLDFWKNASFKKGLILGNTDTIIPQEEDCKKIAQHATYSTILDGGHMLHITEYDKTLDSIEKFLAL